MSALKICPQCGTEYELDQRFCPKDGSTLKSQGATADLLGSVIADRYHVLKKLGEGGMGTVYLAEHVKMGRKSAVKVMNPGTVHDADAISRFNREAANASRINHPNVCAVYDFGETSDGLIYLAMEYVEGPSLTQVIKDAGSLTAERAAEITRQAAEALNVAHDMGIVHRDLKPDNIMLAKNRDGSDAVKVVDFGIAKAANNEAQKVTKTGLVVGTPEYMSPEQLAGDKLDGRSDVYSLGLVAFAMMTGKLPFPADTVQESMIARLTDQPKRLIEMKPEVAWPADVQTVMDKALQRDAVDRYQSASQFGRELHKAVSAMEEEGSHQTTIMRQSFSHKTPPKSQVAAPSAAVSSGATKGIPATAVHKSSKSVHAIPEEKRSRVPMFVGIAAVLIAVTGGGLYAAKLMGGPGGDSSAIEHLSRPQQSGETVTAVSPEVNIFTALDALRPLADSNPETAQVTLDSLRKLEPRATADLAIVQLRYIRAAAYVTLGRFTEACDEVRSVKTKSRDTRFERAVDGLLGSKECQSP